MSYFLKNNNMKKIILVTIFLFAFIIMFSCKKESGKVGKIEEEFVEQVYSKIVIENQDFDFGNISVNDTVSYTYKVKNISEEPLIVTKIVSNCNCVETNYTKTPILKNQELNISAKFISKKENFGPINILMLIECNIEKGAEVISMSGYVSNSLE